MMEMEHLLQLDCQTKEKTEGMFQWKVKRFMKNAKGHYTSIHFKFGGHTGYLKIRYNLLGQLQFKYLDIDLHTTQSSEENLFTKATYFKGGFICRNGELYYHKKNCISVKRNCFSVITCSEKYISVLLEKLDELVPEDILTFRLVWSYKENNIDNLIRQRRFLDKIREQMLLNLSERRSKGYDSFFKSGTTTDCFLVVSDEQLPVHRAVLSARSPVFAAMFQHDTLENRTGVVNISNVDAEIMREVLYYVYTGEIRSQEAKIVVPMFIMADKYALLGMKDDCLDFFMHNLAIENVVHAIFLTHVYEESELEKSQSVHCKKYCRS